MRANLRAATEELIADVGIDATSAKAIAERCGVSRGAMLHHYPTRDDLIIDTARHFWERARDAVDRHAAELSEGRYDVETFVWQLYEEVFRAKALVTMLDLVACGRTDSRIGAAVNEILIDLFHAYEELGLKALSKSGLPPETIRVVINLVVSTLRGLRIQDNIEPDERKVRDVIDMLVVAVNRIIASEGAPGAGSR